ncbi:dTDP-4-amino-4,6-dideoxygalactose transaminase [Hymenobacter sp. BT770]|uniref:dTDP-4-amino-4,6-dideoxygalactose transaminase n=1 Tax=Hymenobacter sp. BT770 TaxID=2886942 RepID=UPI001D107FE9|nr:dTDP-4-amino-4,6-dideoxygalactose transaminase [Hymenobacter sp. BT770]MCC3155071.1 dTDP-4-amino-4,6-dideoxygalactose transaminase [Hymenobacter sp. BT770]MDO3417015.1 dTDP-4-amino-4,6-dideoxygalactose transaminase [Hymenobacter sp. BT770]
MYPAIPFNKPYFSGNETRYIEQAVRSGKISGDGLFTHRVHRFFEQQLGFQKVMLTTSCTDALEMAALLLNIQPGDEVLVPSFTFVSTANAFVLRGAKIVFADSTSLNPNIDAAALESLITPRTRVVVPVHYAGIACDMDAIQAVAERQGLVVVEDAAHAIDSYHRGRALGSLGTLAAFSFHETKNIISGEGGMLAINDVDYGPRAEVIREKGTTRAAFFRGEVDKYGWVDVGSSFLPSDIIAAYLWAQLENLADIQRQRKTIWQRYYTALTPLRAQGIGLPVLPDYATNNGHLFYLVCRSLTERTALITYLKQRGVWIVFHYLSLHKSAYYKAQHDSRALPWADLYSERLVRLPLFYELSETDQDRIINEVLGFYQTY